MLIDIDFVRAEHQYRRQMLSGLHPGRRTDGPRRTQWLNSRRPDRSRSSDVTGVPLVVTKS